MLDVDKLHKLAKSFKRALRYTKINVVDTYPRTLSFVSHRLFKRIRERRIRLQFIIILIFNGSTVISLQIFPTIFDRSRGGFFCFFKPYSDYN